MPLKQITEWQNRPLNPLYPMAYLDCIEVKVRQNGGVTNKAVFLALGINTEGKKALLDIHLSIIHRVRNSLMNVSWKDYKAVTSGLESNRGSALDGVRYVRWHLE